MSIGVIGSLIGNSVGKRLPQAQLKRVFSIFLVVMGTFILLREGPSALAGPDRATESALGEDQAVDGDSR